MDELLGQLGERHSSGAFTTGLERYRPGQPELAVLHAVRAAVLAGAPWVRAQVQVHDCELEFPGPLAEASTLARLLAWLPEPPSAACHYLALACYGALAHSRVDLTHWDGSRCARLHLSAEQGLTVELGREPPWREPRTHLRLRSHREPSAWPSLARPSKVLARAAYAPLRFELNYQELPAPELGGESERRLYAPGTRGVRLASGEGALVAAFSVGSGANGRALLISHGVPLARELPIGRGREAVLSVDDLELGPSAEDLSEEALGEVRRRLADEFEWRQPGD